MNFLRKNYLIILILIIATFLRLYHLPNTMTFLEDEGRDLLIMYKMIDTGRPTLLGPQTSTGNMYLGPLYYYLVTPSLFLFGLNPIGPVVFIALVGVLIVYLFYLMVTAWFGKSFGLLVAFMYAIFPLPVIFARNSWNPNLAPILALIILWYLVKLSIEKDLNWKNFLLLGLFSGAIIQMHYMALLYLVGVGIALIYYLRSNLLGLTKGASISIIGFIIALSPFIFFEFRNNFVNTSAITRFITAKEEHNIRYSLPINLWKNKVIMTTTRMFASSFGKDALTQDKSRTLITIIISILLIFNFAQTAKDNSKSSQIYRLISLVFIIPLLLTGIYQENIHLHYLGFFFPLIYILSGGTKRIAIPITVAILLSVYASPQLLSYLGSSGTNQVVRAQEVADYIVKSAGDTPYSLVSATGTHTTPYLYFASISDHPPTTAVVPTLFIVCQGNPCTDADISTPFIFITGPAHPSISAYLGHPLEYYNEQVREVLSNDHVSNGAWVAKINVKIKQ